MDIPWNYHGWDIWVSMVFSYHFAHLKFPWFVRHGYSMEKRETNPWCANHGNFMWANCMKLPWQFHGNPWVVTMIIPWNAHGIFVSFCSHEISMVCTPWVFHGTPGVISTAIPWTFHGSTMVGSPWVSMEFPWCVSHGNFTWAKWFENSMEIPWNFLWNHHGWFP